MAITLKFKCELETHLEVAKLQSHGTFVHRISCFFQSSGRFHFTLRSDNLGTSFTVFDFFLMELCSSLLCSYSPCCLSFGCHGPLQLCRQTNIFAVERTELIYTLLTSKTISICLLRNLFKANKFSSQFFSKSRTSFSLSERHHSRAAFQAKVN